MDKTDTTIDASTLRGKLITLFYLITRDHLPTGILFDLIARVKSTPSKKVVFSSPGILALAKEVVSDLLGESGERELQADEFMLRTLNDCNILVAALMGRLNTLEIEFTDRQLMAIKDQRQMVQVENFDDPQRGGRVTKLVLNPGDPIVLKGQPQTPSSCT